jgi:hypothetical protein
MLNIEGEKVDQLLIDYLNEILEIQYFEGPHWPNIEVHRQIYLG